MHTKFSKGYGPTPFSNQCINDFDLQPPTMSNVTKTNFDKLTDKNWAAFKQYMKCWLEVNSMYDVVQNGVPGEGTAAVIRAAENIDRVARCHIMSMLSENIMLTFV